VLGNAGVVGAGEVPSSNQIRGSVRRGDDEENGE
jgi:hypothetical protein